MLALLEDLGVSVSWRDEHEVVAARLDRSRAREVDAELAGAHPGVVPARGAAAGARRRGAHAAAGRRLHRPPAARPAPRRAARARRAGARRPRGYEMWAPRRPARLRLLHGRGQRDGDREHPDGRRADAGHDDDPQRRLRAARAEPGAAAGRDGRADRRHRLERPDRARPQPPRRRPPLGSPRTTSRSGSFMALAAVTGGEMRIKGTVPGRPEDDPRWCSSGSA